MMAKYDKGRSILHRLDPTAKLAALAAFCISIFLFDSILFEIIVLMAIILAAYAIGSKSAVSILKSKYAVFLATWLVLAQAIFTPAGTPYFTIPLHFFNIPVTDLGVEKGLVIAFRFIAIIVASGLFVATTEPAELAYSLMRSGLPYRYGFMLITCLRFIPVFEMEMNTVGNAQKARGLDIDKGGLKALIKSIRYTFVPLIVSALSKVDSLVVSMDGRAFGYGPSRTFSRQVRFTRLDAAIVIFSILIVVFLFIDRWTMWVPLPHLRA